MSPACSMMGDRCLRSVAAKIRIDWMEVAFGVAPSLSISDLVMSVTDGSVSLTRLFVLVITADAGTVVIVVSLERSMRSVSGARTGNEY